MFLQRVFDYKWLLIASLILLGNITVYQFSFVHTLTDEQVQGMVTGSLIDCAIIAPALLLLHQRKWSLKNFVVFIAAGILFARIVIPTTFIEPFRYLTWSALAVEAGLVVIELTILFVFINYLPSIIREVKAEKEQLIFALPRIVTEKVKDNLLIKVLCSELLVFYYAFYSWGKKPSIGFTVYKNTMYVPFLLMIFHAALFEAVAFHWFFYDRMPFLAWAHTILSIYGLLFLLADYRALKLNPSSIKNGQLYLSNGLFKRTQIDVSDIKKLHAQVEEEKVCPFKVLGNTEEIPSFVIEMNHPQSIYLVGGFEKQSNFIGVYADDPITFRREIETAMEERNI